MTKSDFINKIYFEPLDKQVVGFLSESNINFLRNNATNISINKNTGKEERVTVKSGMEYRPDKIAAYYLGNERLGWIIDITNEFYNGIKDYYLGRELKIPTEDSLELLTKR